MASNRNHYYDIWSSDSSEDDDYNYLKALDNINWNNKRKESALSSTSLPIERRNVAKNGSKPASRLVVTALAKPAVAVKSRNNRNDFLFKDIAAAEKDKTKDISKNDTIGENKKRDFDLMAVNEDIDDIPEIDDCISPKTDDKSDKTSNYPNSKRPKVDKTNGSDYNINEVINQKKANHEKCVTNNNNKNVTKSVLNRVKNDRVFGKAFSPTVYSPEVPVMSRTVTQQISNVAVIQKALTFSEDNGSIDSPYHPNRILSIILDWNTKWLQECNSNEVPNLLSPFGEGIGVKTSYDSGEEYQSAYIPLILFETWAQIFKDFSNEKTFEFDAVRGPEIKSQDRFLKLELQTVVPKNRVNNYPSDGYLILMEVTIDFGATNERRKVVLFGYIDFFSQTKITSNTALPPGIAMPNSSSNPQLLKYIVSLSKKPIRISHGEKIKVRAIHYLRPTMRQIELIFGLNSSPLFKDILKPRSFTCQVVVPNNLTQSTNFNESQHRAIIGSSEALSRPYAVPKILFIQGPPGTGKTHTLIGIIKHIYIHWDKEDRLPRILICAPSNGAVDEISRRLYRERNFLVKHKVGKHQRALRCVRVGKESQIHPDVRQILYDTLIRDNAASQAKRLKDEKDKKTKEIEAKVSKLDQEIADYRANKSKDKLKAAEKQQTDLIFKLQELSESNVAEEADKNGSKSRLKSEIMVKADIVLSTLNSCHSSPIERLYQQFGPKTFDCVIVDEASQCSEPELLMPLTYKMTKMILIGDPMQLPATIISKKASSLQLGRSLFERFYHFFRQCEREDPKQTNPILMLTEQYRMHPQICHFPSQQFYDGRLVSSAKVQKCREFKLKPYIVFDVTDSIENKNDPTNKYNELEANFVIRLVSLIDNILESNSSANQKANQKRIYSVGIITPYNGQKSHLNTKLNDKTFKNLSVEINTVDGFQGQERDIIILSAVRAFDNQNNNKWQTIGFLDSVQRMNVALTRAKYSMILCISGRSLETNKNWKSLIDDAIKRSNCRFKVPSTLSSDTLKKMLSPMEDTVETISIAD